MIRRADGIRAAFALVFLLIPYLLLFVAGSIWLYQSSMLIAWGSLALACTAAGWLLLRSVRWRVRPPQVQPEPTWPPQGMEVWKEVEELAERIAAEDLPLDQPERWFGVVRRVLDLVAGHYHPGASEPWLETPAPHALRILELVCRDLRQAAVGYLPGSHILTLGDLRRLQKLAGVARNSYFWYRVGSFVVNTPAAFLREARDAIFGKLRDISTEAARQWAIGYFVRRTGYYAIQLYGRHMTFDDTVPGEAPLRQSQQDARTDAQRTESLDKEPLRILVLGQTKAGKSSLINALFGRRRAADDVVPCTDRVEPYVLEREGLPQAVVLDTAGYDAAEGRDPLAPLLRHLHDSDLVICVCSAASAARQADRRVLDGLRAEFQRNPDRHPPVMMVALTHIDRLRPIQEWAPPYRLDPPDGTKAGQIVEAVEAVAADLSLPPADVIPVCTLPERIYNVDEALAPALLERLPAAQRVKYVRCLRQHADEQHWRRLWQQAVAAGRVARDWLRRR